MYLAVINIWNPELKIVRWVPSRNQWSSRKMLPNGYMYGYTRENLFGKTIRSGIPVYGYVAIQIVCHALLASVAFAESMIYFLNIISLKTMRYPTYPHLCNSRASCWWTENNENAGKTNINGPQQSSDITNNRILCIAFYSSWNDQHHRLNV